MEVIVPEPFGNFSSEKFSIWFFTWKFWGLGFLIGNGELILMLAIWDGV